MCILCVAAAGVAAAAEPIGASTPAVAPAFIVAKFVSPVLFSIAGFNVYSYGTMVAAALGVAFLVFGKELQRARIDLDEIYCFFVFLAGFAIGSKAHVALSALAGGEELTWAALDIRTGHSFMGSQIGAVLFMLAYIKCNGVGVLAFLDVLLPCCLLGHTVGKGGCFLSGDGCYGPPADPSHVPWAMSFPNASMPTEVPVHPTPLYEAACSFAVFTTVRTLIPLPPAPGDDDDGKQAAVEMPIAGRRAAMTLVLYGVERVLLENYRRHPPVPSFGGLTEYQVVALGLLAVGGAVEAYGRWHRKRKSKMA